MKVSGIICEYNPLHKGHCYHINKTRNHGADAIVCVMSGNFVQRGDFAIMRKHARAESAILAGADLVLELPTPWAIASAEGFARGAIGILNALGIVSHLSFGCELDNTSKLTQVAELLLTEEFYKNIRIELKSGCSFAAARENVVAENCPELSALLQTPNNILAIEYIKALLASSSLIKPEAIKREGCAHDADEVTGSFASASAIRKMIYDGNFSFAYPYMTLESMQIFERECTAGLAPVLQKSADRTILSHLKRMSKTDFLNVPDVSEGLEVRLCHAVCNAKTLDEAISAAKTKRYAHSRIRRVFLAAFLSMSRETSASLPSYARVLAFNDTGRTLLKMCHKSALIPIITKPADVHKFGVSDAFSKEALRTELYSLFMPQPQTGMQDFKITPIYVKGCHQNFC